MYGFIRLMIGCVFLAACVAGIKKFAKVRKRWWYIALSGLAAILVVVLQFFPFENLFVTFHSPKAAYEYFCFGKSNIELVVEGAHCDFVVDRKKDADNYLLIPKTADGWKVGIGSDMKWVVHQYFKGTVINVYQYKDTSDYFITILDTNGGESTISDEYNSKFFSLERYNDSLGKNFVTYYASIPNFNSQYSVTVNNTEMVLKSQ